MRMGAGQDDGDETVARIEEPELPTPVGPSILDPRRVVAPDPEPGDLVGPYRLESELGRGGAGTVFKATHSGTGAVVALKVLAASKVKRARIVQRFFDEVRAASSVAHPGLIKGYDFIEIEQPRRLAYAMEFVDGESLRARLKKHGALDLRTAIAVGRQICQALGALHQAGIIHRDLKPENILLVGPKNRPNIKLLDFGVVKFLPVDKTEPAQTVAAAAGTFVGTPRYMAPEQAAGAAIDHRADLFAFGVLMFEMVTGRSPHDGDSLRDVVLAKLKGAPRITVNPEQEVLPEELTDVVDDCLQLNRSLRPRSADDVVQKLSEAESILAAVGRPVRADSVPPTRAESGMGRPTTLGASGGPGAAVSSNPAAPAVLGDAGLASATSSAASANDSDSLSRTESTDSLAATLPGTTPRASGSSKWWIALLGVVLLATAVAIAAAGGLVR